MEHAIGFIAAAFLIALPIPQFLTLRRAPVGEPTGVNPGQWWLVALVSALFCGYAYQQGAVALLAGNALSLATVLPTAVLAVYKPRGRLLAASTALAAVCAPLVVVAAARMPLPILVALVTMASLASLVPQLVTSIRAYLTRQHTRVSIGSFLILATMQTLWIAYGVLRADWLLVGLNVVGILVSGTVLALTTLGNRRTLGSAPSD